MKVIRALLLIFGISLMIGGFLHQHTKNFTFFCNAIAPDYHDGMQALSRLANTTKLERERVVHKGEEGFVVLLDLFFSENWIRTGANISDKESVEEFRGVGTFTSFSISGAQIPSIMIFVKSKNGEEATILSYQVRLYLEQLLDKRLFSWSIILLFFGVIMTVIGYVLD